MTLFKSLADNAHLSDVFKRFPDNAGQMLTLLEGILRSEGALSIGERELIAAYVSGLNDCVFCYSSHKVYSEIFGISTGVVDDLLDDIETADVPERLKPILRYVKKLNEHRGKMTPQDAEDVFAAGWSEDALYEAIQVSAVFKMMNTIVEGCGVTFDYGEHQDVRRELRNRRRHSYLDFGRRLGVIAPEDDSLNM